MTGPALDWEKVGRYLAGESPPDEAATVRRWLEQHPEDARLLEALNTAAQVARAESRVDIEAALRIVKTRMHAQPPPPARTYAFGSAQSWRRYASWAAAAAVILVAGMLVKRRSPSGDGTSATRIYVTGVGERNEVHLDDGTRVILGPASRLTVAAREARLTGEAFFSVTHDSLRPFTIRAGDATVRDIGTDFTMHSDSGEAVRVVVSQGIVELRHAQDSVILVRGDVGVLDERGRVQASRGAATEDDLAWTQGRLVFRDASLAELAADLRRWYGVEIRVTDSALVGRHFTGSFTTELPARVLDVIALAFGARVDRRGDTAYIRTPPPAR